jgi:RNA polymerase sigma factor (sigma-70 family)
MTDTDLLSQLKNRDENTCRSFIDQYKERVFRLCLSFVNNREDAEELTQDVFLEALNRIDTFRQDSQIQTWLYRIAINKSLNLIRSRKKHTLLEILGMSPAVEKEIHDRGLLLSQENAETGRITEENNRILFHAISSLKEDQRIAFTLNKVDGFSYAEVAEIMKISIAKTESLIHRAKNNLREKLVKVLDG